LALCFGLVSPMGAYSKTIGQVSLRFIETFISIFVWNVLEIVLCFRPDLFVDVEYFRVKRVFSISFQFSMGDAL
jgi:hypothetical protein